MFKTIMVPVDLRHEAALDKSLKLAAELARTHQATVVYTGVTSPEPSELGHNPSEYAQRLDSFAQAQAAAHGIDVRGHAMVTHDPAVDLEKALSHAIDDVQADLVVMATHVPGLKDYIWASHGSHLARHAKVSVFLVRG